MKKLLQYASYCLCILLILFSGDLAAQKPKKKLKTTFNKAAAKPPAPPRVSKPRTGMHYKPRPTLGPNSHIVRNAPPPRRTAPSKPTTTKGKFNKAAAPSTSNRFNAKAAPPKGNKSKAPAPSVRKKFNRAARGNGQ